MSSVSKITEDGQFFCAAFFHESSFVLILTKMGSAKFWAVFSQTLLVTLTDRVARFLLLRNTKTGRNVPKQFKMYQMVINFPKCP
jgi:hypothetical protein